MKLVFKVEELFILNHDGVVYIEVNWLFSLILSIYYILI